MGRTGTKPIWDNATVKNPKRGDTMRRNTRYIMDKTVNRIPSTQPTFHSSATIVNPKF
jgi:hypothetical protein